MMEKKLPEILALYLPQFHQIPENDLWWGEGFTEWTAVRNAAVLFPDHNQPRIPLNNNYYNLLEYSTMKWQAELAKKYHIDGFCFYHYWFEEGKRVLQKPAENLLEWKDIHMPFCFCWANETWCRTWSNIQEGNVWSSIHENVKDGEKDTQGILLRQRYGREKQWKEHFLYLLRFFKDNRYIKVDGKPVLVIYKPDEVPCLYSMVRYWRGLAEENGLPGIYMIGMKEGKPGALDALCYKEPGRSFYNMLMRRKGSDSTLKTFDYNEIWKEILDNDPGRDQFLCAVTDHDATPRKGMNGECIMNASPRLFREYFSRLLHQGIERGHRFLFINAWNEWGEGMYLEPDERYGYGYLEAVKQSVEKAWEAAKDIREIIPEEPDISKAERKLDKVSGEAKMWAYFQLTEQWLTLLEKGIRLETYFIRQNIRKVAIYGTGILGRHLAQELSGSSVELVCGIERGGNVWKLNIPVFDSCEEIPVVDAVVVTPFLQFVEIAETLYSVLQCPIISINEIIFDLQ